MPSPARIDDLFTELSRCNTDLVAGIVLQKPELYEELFALFLRNEEPVSRRAAWVVDIVAEQRPGLLAPHIPEIIRHLRVFSHGALKRHSLRMLARSPLPQGDDLGILMQACFDWLLAQEETVSSKVYSMEILYRISQTEPELKKELADSIEWRLNEETPGFRNRGQKLLKKLYAEMEGPSRG
jgi:hypothetical protein